MTAAAVAPSDRDPTDEAQPDTPHGLTPDQYARLGVTVDVARQCHAWAQAYGPLSTDQRARLGVLLHPYCP